MKKLLTLLFVLASFASFGQSANVFTGIEIKNSKVADSIRIRKMWYDEVSQTFKFWDGTGKHSIGSPLSFSNGLTNTAGAVKLGGALTQNTSIDGNFNLGLGASSALSNLRVRVSTISFTPESQLSMDPGIIVIQNSFTSDNQYRLQVDGSNPGFGGSNITMHGGTGNYLTFGDDASPTGSGPRGLNVYIGTSYPGSLRLSISEAGVWTANFGSDATGDTYYRNSSGNLVRLAAGTLNYVLTSGGPGVAPSWAASAGGGMTNPMTAVGDLIQGTTAGAPVRLASVATGNALISGGVTTANSWGKITSAHIDATVQTAGLSWLLTGTSTLTGVATITSNAKNQHIFNGTWTATAAADAHIQFGGTLTAASGLGVTGYVINPSLAAVGTSSVQVGLDVAPTFSGGTTPINIAARFQNGGVIIGNFSAFSGNESLLVRKDQNGVTRASIVNTTSGTAAFSQFVVATSANLNAGVEIDAFSAGYSTSGINVANTGVINGYQTGGLNIGTTASAQLSFWTNNIQRATFLSTGQLILAPAGTSSGASNMLQVLGNIAINSSSGVMGMSMQVAGQDVYIDASLAAGGINLRTNGSTIAGSFTSLQNFNVGVANGNNLARLYVLQPALISAGGLPAFQVDGGAHTSLTASTEVLFANFNSSATVQYATGAQAILRNVLVQAPTIRFTGASVVTDNATFTISGAPKTGTNATQTNAHGLLIQAAAVTSAGAAFGLTSNAPTGGTLNYAGQFLGGLGLIIDQAIIGTNGKILFDLTGSVTSAVNYIKVVNSISGSVPGLLMIGSDTNIGFGILTKGAGDFSVSSSTQSLTNPSFNQISTFKITHYAADGLGANIKLSKTRGTPGSPASINNGDDIGKISFEPYESTGGSIITAFMKGIVNGTVAANSIPTDIVFYTGSTVTPSETFRIESTGAVSMVAKQAAAPATTGTMTTTLTNLTVMTITPTGACTFNASGGIAGQQCSFVITTSGASSFVLTWGTNYKTTGTLATGTVTAKVFTVNFIYDGVNWNEQSRTTAM